VCGISCSNQTIFMYVFNLLVKYPIDLKELQSDSYGINEAMIFLKIRIPIGARVNFI